MIKNIFRLFAASALCLAVSPVFAQPTAESPAKPTSATLMLDRSEKKPNEYWEKAVARFKSVETTAPRHGIVLFGDSITARWPEGLFPGEKVINRGIGGDHIGGWKYLGLLDRMDTSITVLEPKRVYLLIGINDMLAGGAPMENMVAAYGRLLDELQKAAPDAEIYVHSILPVSKPDFSYMKKPILELNGHIERLAKEKHLHFIDLYPHFVNEDEDLKPELTNDGVHLTPEGYKLWLKVLKENNALPPETVVQ